MMVDPNKSTSHADFLAWLASVVRTNRCEINIRPDGPVTVSGEFGVPEKTIVTITIHRDPARELPVTERN